MKTRWILAALLVASLVAARSLQADSKAPGADVKCPVSGKAVDAAATVDFNGGKVYFCCMNCPKAFSANTEKFTAKANKQLVQTAQLEQTACPLTGKVVNAETEIDVQGVKVAFCCNNCKGKVAAASGDAQLDLVFKNTSKGFTAAK